MLHIIAILFVVLIIAFSTYSGVRDGAFTAINAFVRNITAFFVTMTFCEPLATVLARLFDAGYPAYDYFLVMSFGVIAGATMTLLRRFKIKCTAPSVPCKDIVDRIAGPVFGFAAGFMLTGMVLIGFTMMPALKYMPSGSGDVAIAGDFVDTGGRLLRYYSYAQRCFGGYDGFLLDENEIVNDLNYNGQPDIEGESWEDRGKADQATFPNGEWDRGWLVRYRDHASMEPYCLYRLSEGGSGSAPTSTPGPDQGPPPDGAP